MTQKAMTVRMKTDFRKKRPEMPGEVSMVCSYRDRVRGTSPNERHNDNAVFLFTKFFSLVSLSVLF